MSLPHATQAQINKMNEIAEQRMKQDGVTQEPVQVEPITTKHPMLQHHEEPDQSTMQNEASVTDLHASEQNNDSIEEVVQAPTKKVETRQQMNFRTMRERLERAERERDEAMKYAMKMHQPQPQEQFQEQEEDYLAGLGIDADSLAEGKHLKAVLKEVKDLKKELNSYKTRTTEDTTRIKLHNELPDYQNVMTERNINQLESMNPDLAEMIANTPDMYKRARLAYDMVKRHGIYKDPFNERNKIVAKNNSAKPKPLASISPQQSDSPLSKANAFANMPLSKDIKDQLHREMIAAMKGR